MHEGKVHMEAVSTHMWASHEWPQSIEKASVKAALQAAGFQMYSTEQPGSELRGIFIFCLVFQQAQTYFTWGGQN